MMVALIPVSVGPLPEERPVFGAVDDSTATVERVLAALKVRKWPLPETVLDGIFEDLEQVLGEQSFPDEAEVDTLLRRTRGSLMQLVAAIPDSDVGPGPVDGVVDKARSLVSSNPSGGPLGPKVLLRRMALTVVDLLDQLEPLP
ncbi:DUF6415 family natural product biosynthesis protein [Streptomyces sp. NPDC056638]|uniref:DUF6415 family natural product biosynthesis protein n=1 Tax=Streptomyces sp. NPDC056638 TaxID=3345887 RepID=UPI0036AD588F